MSLEKINVWLVLYTEYSIDVVGIFSDLQKAVEVCKNTHYVVGPFEVDKDYTEVKQWVGAFRPLGGPLYPENCKDNSCGCGDCQ